MGDVDPCISVYGESLLRYHPSTTGRLTQCPEAGVWTVSGGEFDWGGRLLKSNGGVQRFPQSEWKSDAECKGIRELDCETNRSSRVETRT